MVKVLYGTFPIVSSPNGQIRTQGKEKLSSIIKFTQFVSDRANTTDSQTQKVITFWQTNESHY